MATNPTIIVGHLSDEELRKSIDALVDTVDKKFSEAADKAIPHIENIEKSILNIGVTTTKVVFGVKALFAEMGTTFDDFAKAMERAASASRSIPSGQGVGRGSGSGSGTGSGTSNPPDPDTIAGLKAEIAELQKLLDLQQQHSRELQNQVNILALQKKSLKEQTTDSFTKEWKDAFSFPARQIDDARTKLKKLNDIAANYKGTGFMSPDLWNKLRNEIQKTEKKIKDLENAAARVGFGGRRSGRTGVALPQNFIDVLAMSEKGVDAIALKMKALRGLKIDPANKEEVKKLADEYQRLKKLRAEFMGQSDFVIRQNSALARSFNYIRNRLIYALTVGTITNFTKQIYEVRGQYELLERSLGVLVGSFQRGSQIFQELSDMAIKSPFTLVELGSAAKQLTAYNFAANEVVDVTRRMADLSAALGVPMERLTYNLGQIRAQTVLTARDARDFANAGLPIIKDLADYYSELEGRVVSTGDVYDRMSKKMVSFTDVMAVLNQMTDEGGKFFDFQAKQAETLKVQMANLTLAWNNMLNEIGEKNQSTLEMPLQTLRTLLLHWKGIEQALTDVVVTIGIFKGAQLALDLLVGKGNATLQSQILLSKRKMAQDLQRKALTEELTAEEQTFLAVSNKVTVADYKRVLAAKEVTKEQAIMMLALQRWNWRLKEAIVEMGLLTQAEADNIRMSTVLRMAFMRVGVAAKFMWLSFVQSLPALLAFAAIGGIVQFIQSWNEEIERAAALNHKLAENAKEVYGSIGQFLDNYSKSLEKLENGELAEDEQRKLWDAIREEILKSVAEAENYVAELMKIENISDRIKRGRDILDDTERIATILEKIGDKGLLMMGRGEIVGDDAAEDIKEYVEYVDEYIAANGNAIKSFKAVRDIYGDLWGSADEAREEIYATTLSLSDSFNKFRNEILGDDPKKWADNIKQYAAQAQQALLNSDVGKKLTGQQLSYFKIGIDEWVSETIKSVTNVANFVGGKEERESEIYIARTLTAWRDFYASVRLLGKNDRERLLELVKDGKYLQKEYSEEFKTLWNKAAEEMRKTARISYMTIMDDIDDLNKQKIIIPVVFRQEADNRTPLQKQFDEDFQGRQFRFIAPTEREKNLMDYGKRVTKQYKETSKELEDAKKQLAEIPEEQSVIYNNQLAYVKGLEEELEVEETIINAWHLISLEKEKATKVSKKDLLLDSLKQSIDLIKKAQSEYDTLTQKGASSADALDSVYSNYGRTLKLLNSQLAGFNLPQIDLSRLIKGKNPNDILSFFKDLSSILESRGLSNLERQKAVEVVIQEFSVKAQTYNLDMITKGLDNELGRLKDEYELAVELDANPELGNLFADIWGINIDELPKTVKEYAKRATTYLNRYLSKKDQGLQFGEGELFNLTASDMRAFEQMVVDKTLSQEAYDRIEKVYESIRDKRLKDTKETMTEWNKLLEKYSEYEYKLGQIQKTAVRKRLTFAKKNGTQEQQQTAVQLVTQIDAETDAEKKLQLISQLKELVKEIAGEDGVKIQIVTDIDEKELEDSAQLSFEQFQKDPTWLTATGDLAGLTDSALGLLISRIEEYKKTAKNLTPKQIKQINNALKQLHQQVRKGNPFHVLSLAMKESKGRMDGYKKKIKDLTEAEEDLYQQLEGESDSGKRTALSKQIQEVAEEIKKTKEEMEGVGETDFSAVLNFTNSLIQGASQAEGAFSSMFKAMGNTEFAETMDKVTNVLSQTASLAAAGFQMGGAWGAAIGGVIGLGTSLITNFAEQWSGNKGITEAIQESEKAVRSLEVAYKRLDVAINNAYGDQVIGAKRATVENKKLQLAELERQLQLEKSRKAKYRDDDKIVSLQGQIIELKEEIANATKDIVNDLLGISSVGDAAENAVASMIEAFKNGEDYMKVFDETFEDMIDNMIVKAISAQVIGDRIQAVFDLVKQKSIERADNTLYEGIHNEGAGKGKTFREQIAGYEDVIQDATSKGLDSLADLYQSHLNELLDEYNEVARIRPDDIKNLQDVIDSLKENAQDEFLAYMEAFGISFGQGSENDLSNLQQGIQNVSESTAGAIEGYLNGMSQQAYLRNDLLTQIRDSILTFNFDAHLAVQSQMLLQMQSSYQEQQTIRSIMEGWSNANGMAVRVEMV